jgi:hypothetical protein
MVVDAPVVGVPDVGVDVVAQAARAAAASVIAMRRSNRWYMLEYSVCRWNPGVDGTAGEARWLTAVDTPPI